MYKKTSNAVHFQKHDGSFATRVDSRGYSEFGEIELQPPVLVQLNKIVEGAGTDTEAERVGGHYLKLLRNEQRAAFEAIFTQVANARLPKHVFLSIQEEARRIWRSEYADIVPPAYRNLKKRRHLLNKGRNRE